MMPLRLDEMLLTCEVALARLAEQIGARLAL